MNPWLEPAHPPALLSPQPPHFLKREFKVRTRRIARSNLRKHPQAAVAVTRKHPLAAVVHRASISLLNADWPKHSGIFFPAPFFGTTYFGPNFYNRPNVTLTTNRPTREALNFDSKIQNQNKVNRLFAFRGI
ncbi:hypothetical protein QN277_004560 [Acacia crassicarpa]|uniref:Uncharacterized protein n=1 Tax=Acacia crassicarpa TaxID=499986 RepID=A0AAE1J380_9FABA|nr:hypothetical protein QN277_004560 [Acacia crassicarpa]